MKSLSTTTKIALFIVPLFLFVSATGHATNPWAKAVVSYSNVVNPTNAVGEPDDIGAAFIGSGYIILDMGRGEEIPSYTGLTFTLRNPSGYRSRAYAVFSTNLIQWSAPLMITQNIATFFMDYWIIAPKGGPFRYIKIISYPDVQIDAITADAPLPVQLVSFSGRLTNGSVKLDWSTATEINNYGFSIEHKANDHWIEIGFVDGHGTVNTPQKYSFVDNNPALTSTVTYRLKQIDRDGKIEYSPTVDVKMNVKETVVLEQNYPNPFGTATLAGNPTTNISFSLAETQEIKLKVYDMNGQLIETLAYGLHSAGNYVIPFDGMLLSSGTYLYSLETANNRIVKQMRLMK